METCKIVKVMTDVKIECEPRFRWLMPSKGETRLQAYEREARDWVKEFTSFLRDHRSQDDVHFDVVTTHENQCSNCDREFELCHYETEGLIQAYDGCAYCGAALIKEASINE